MEAKKIENNPRDPVVPDAPKVGSVQEPQRDDNRSLWRRVGQRIVKSKSKLPANGDFLFITESPVEEVGQDDLAAHYERPDTVRSQVRWDDLDVVKLIYERAKAHESKVEAVATLTRDKAKTLLGASSLLSAIFLGFVSLFSSVMPRFRWWATLIELILFALLASHLLNALLKALGSLTWETSEWPSPRELLLSETDRPDGPSDKPTAAYREAIAQTVAYANKNHGYILTRNKRVQLGQGALRFALIYFALFVGFHIFALTLPRNAAEEDTIKKATAAIERIATVAEQASTSIASGQREQAAAIKQLDTKLSTLLQAPNANRHLPKTRRRSN